MGTFVQGMVGAVFIALTAICVGCGGGTTAVIQQPQAADFSLGISSSSVTISQGAAVPGLAMHPTGALIYQPFLTGAASAPNVRGGVDISDARSGELRLRVFLPQQFMTDVDALHRKFLTIDENGQRLFAITLWMDQIAALTVVQLAAVPLAIGSVSSKTISAVGGTSLKIRGSGFQPGIKLTIGGKPAMATLVDMNTLTVVSPVVLTGPQQLTLTNANGETVSLDAAVIAN